MNRDNYPDRLTIKGEGRKPSRPCGWDLRSMWWDS